MLVKRLKTARANGNCALPSSGNCRLHWITYRANLPRRQRGSFNIHLDRKVPRCRKKCMMSILFKEQLQNTLNNPLNKIVRQLHYLSLISDN